jgi:hypothetical protein
MTYTSPFPRKKSNDDVLRMSRIISAQPVETSDKVKLCFEIPPSLTKSYMLKNTFYFDIKNKTKNNSSHLNTNKNKNKNIKTYNTARPKSSTNVCVTDINKIKYLLNTKENLLFEEKKLNEEKEKINQMTKKLNNAMAVDKNVIINQLLNNKHPLNPTTHKNFGTVPE